MATEDADDLVPLLAVATRVDGAGQGRVEYHLDHKGVPVHARTEFVSAKVTAFVAHLVARTAALSR